MINIPEGTSGEWTIKKEAGETHLYREDILVMSDALDERKFLQEFGIRVYGDVLINGLGIGLAVSIALDDKEVNSVVVNEISSDVLKLVAPSYCHDVRLVLNKANAYTWEPQAKQRFDVIWHDISYGTRKIMLFEIANLYKRYAKFLKEGGWQASWEATVLGIEIKEIS